MMGIEEDETSKVVSDAKMYLVVSSNMGLCGGYNANIINMNFVDIRKRSVHN